ncbi:hypothetical protein DM01DRAFT_1336840 [Hesseltinella vesiculosa]|uniref:Uncharacterized protein n=1 Tax=Hesseltinella vesiculosa TaxID=101127 RepID=A0A1X2GFG3_9FUNG|nr:hypothetical protein DM01DRAFT_1336840 [Hesseltinella vesiculosa]
MKRIVVIRLFLSFLFLAVLPAMAEVPTAEQVQTWTKEKVATFLQKYNLAYDEHDQALAQKAAEYQELAKDNAHYFGAKVNEFVDKAKEHLQKDQQASVHVDNIVADIRHRLRRLELQGALSRDNVDQSLEHVRRQLTQKKWITASHWHKIQKDIQAAFVPAEAVDHAWYQRILKPSPSKSGSQSLDRWLNNVRTHLAQLRVLTEDQVNQVVQQLRQAVTIHNLNKVASPHWYERLYHRLEKNANLSRSQLEDVKEVLSKQVSGFKVFASDYLGDKKDQATTWLDELHHQCDKAMVTTSGWMNDLLEGLGIRKKQGLLDHLNSGNHEKKKPRHAPLIPFSRS